MKQKKPIRPMCEILLDMEVLLNEMTEDHGLQYGDIIYNIYSYLEIHSRYAKEEYMDGTFPVLYYGPANGITLK